MGRHFWVVALAFRCQNSVAKLSVLLNTVRSRTSKHCAIASRCNKPPASSKSEFEILPSGFLEVTSLSINDVLGPLESPKYWSILLYPLRGTKCLAGNHTPPAPLPEAS
eukprot:scaffold4594_cov141-Skeletonema_dohrnii-CCMP3373.AAC.3